MEITPAISTRYRAYLQTSEWRAKRNRALKRAIFQCERCAARRGLEVHHRTYERLTRELDGDLEVLCRDCHEGHHAQQMADSPAERVYLKLAGEVQRDAPFTSIADLSDAVKTRCARLKIPYDQHQVDKALSIICGANRFTPTPQTPTEILTARADGRAMTHAESRETLHRLGLIALFKEMPRDPPSTIEIDAPVYVERVDHDCY